MDPSTGHGHGGSRLATQLIGIRDDSGYHFDFSRLERWVGLCAKHGIEYLEIAHLFTQWGAKATPAIYVETAEGLKRRFGWDVPSTSSSYRELMAELLPALRSFLAEHWSLDRSFSTYPMNRRAPRPWRDTNGQRASSRISWTV
ncbi:conserved hypothetical protein [Arthrobacter sp. Hiyo8]|nr:conserved hypothetical protein [Arthrobacter sp. Hiyo8]